MTTEELTIAMFGVKNEVLDIKEGLADYDTKIDNIESGINQAQLDLSKKIDNNLKSYVKIDTLSNYYDKYYIDELLNSIMTLSEDDVKNYLVENEYITKSSLSGYSTNIDMKRYVDESLDDYLTIEKANLKYISKNELDKIILNNEIDLSGFAKTIELKNYYTKSQVDSLIPSLIGYVKKSELFGLLPFDDYVLKSYVKENFVRKGEISMDGYVTTNMLNAKISSLGKIITLSDVDDKLDDYVKNSEMNERLSQLSNTIFNYVTQELEERVKNDEFKIKLKNYVTFDDLSDYLLGKDDDENKGVDLSKYAKLSDLKNYVKKDEVNEIKSEIFENVSKKIIPYELKIYLDEKGYKDEEYLYKNFVSNKNFREYLESIENDKKEDDNNDLTSSNYVLKSELDEKLNILSETINTTFDTLVEEKGFVTEEYLDEKGYKDEEYLYKNFVSNKNFREYLESIENDKKEDDNNNSNNNCSLVDYVRKSELDEKLNILSSNINSIIPFTFNALVEEKGLITKSYSDSKYATKSELRVFENMFNNIGDSEPDMSLYVKKSQLSDYVLKTYVDGTFVDLGTFSMYKTRVNSDINDINNTFKKYVTNSTLSSYLRIDEFNNIMEDYVNKNYLNNEIKNIMNNVNNSLSNGDETYLTSKDYEKMKKYVSSILQNYAVSQEIYSYVNQNFVKNIELSSALNDDYYTKNKIDSIFLTKTNAEKTYLTKSEALSDYLSKEDYRGIKNAMTLNSSYRDAENIFDALIETGKLNDGFYIVGDSVVIVKDGQKFCTPNMTGSGYITENELKRKGYITRDEFEENKGKNWITDTGGNY